MRRGMCQSDDGAQVRLEKMKSVVSVKSSFMAELAALDNVRLEVVLAKIPLPFIKKLREKGGCAKRWPTSLDSPWRLAGK